jgi:hypothetical protein
MKHPLHIPLLAALTVLLLAPDGFARRKNIPMAVGTRVHTEHSEYDDYPYVDDTWSYGLAYEYKEGNGMWQVAINYADNVDVDPGEVEVDQIITPALNLLFIDEEWIAGTGVLSSYVETDEDSDWTDIYWQLMLGYAFTLGKVDLSLVAYFPYEDWGALFDFQTSDLEYGAWFHFTF